MILYSPHIGTTIPAFLKTGKIKIPFSHNIGVNKEEVTGMYLLIKNISNQKQIGLLETTEINYDEGYAIFNNVLNNSLNSVLNAGTYYKFQIAYSDGSGEANLHFSTVAIGRCVGQAVEFHIEDANGNRLNSNGTEINYSTSSFIGVYKPFQNEPAYKYRFILERNNVILDDTNWITPASEKNYYTINQELQKGFTYDLTFQIITVNGYEDKKTVKITPGVDFPIYFNGSLHASYGPKEKEEGCIKLYLTGQDTTITGEFQILRKEISSNVWEVIKTFSMLSIDNIEDYFWYDCSIESGKTYSYALRQYVPESNSQIQGVASEKIVAPEIITPFLEHIYLSDGEKQLCIKFNPKISSFKNTILEQKTDTIGGKYPFFFRNGIVNYKEIPISGLISYLMDNENFFMPAAELGLKGFKTTNLTKYNFNAERKFKNAVLEWLTDGKPKLFRSAAEGNYALRLMNISLSPQETLGRMLHTFSATGYECMDNSFKTLYQNNLVLVKENKTPITSQIAQLSNIMNKVRNSTNLEIEGIITDIYYSHKEVMNIPAFEITFLDNNTSQIFMAKGETIHYPNVEKRKIKLKLLDIQGDIVYKIEQDRSIAAEDKFKTMIQNGEFKTIENIVLSQDKTLREEINTNKELYYYQTITFMSGKISFDGNEFKITKTTTFNNVDGSVNIKALEDTKISYINYCISKNDEAIVNSAMLRGGSVLG